MTLIASQCSVTLNASQPSVFSSCFSLVWAKISDGLSGLKDVSLATSASWSLGSASLHNHALFTVCKCGVFVGVYFFPVNRACLW